MSLSYRITINCIFINTLFILLEFIVIDIPCKISGVQKSLASGTFITNVLLDYVLCTCN